MKRLPTAFMVLGLCIGTHAEAATYNASNATELKAAMRLAKSGDTILLAGGDYGDFTFQGFKVAGDTPLIIRALSDTDRPRFSKLVLSNARNLLFAGLDMQSKSHPLINMIGGQSITIMNSRLTGATRNNDAWDDDLTAIRVRSSSNIKLLNNIFHDLRVCLYTQNTNSLVVRHNECRNVREGFDIVTLKNGDISHNLFHSFQPNYGKGEHADAIQLWTRNEIYGSENVIFKNNYFALGNNGAVHGIFIRSEAAETGKVPDAVHRNLSFIGNVYYGSALHGISLNSVHGAVITGNVVVASPWADRNDSSYDSADGRDGGALQPQIYVTAKTNHNIIASGNIAMKGVGASPNGSQAFNNIDIYDTERKVGVAWETVFASRPTSPYPPLSAFRTLPKSPAALSKVGMLTLPRVGNTSIALSNAASFAASTPLP